MICKHDRLARACEICELEQRNVELQEENERLKRQLSSARSLKQIVVSDNIAELESAHKMMHARNERLQKEADELAEALRKADEELVKIHALIERKHYDEECLKGIEYIGISLIREVLSKYGLSE